MQWAAATLKGLAEFQNIKSRTLFTIIFSQKCLIQELRFQITYRMSASWCDRIGFPVILWGFFLDYSRYFEIVCLFWFPEFGVEMNPHNPFGGILWSLNRISTKEGFLSAKENNVKLVKMRCKKVCIFTVQQDIDFLNILGLSTDSQSILSNFGSFLGGFKI